MLVSSVRGEISSKMIASWMIFTSKKGNPSCSHVRIPTTKFIYILYTCKVNEDTKNIIVVKKYFSVSKFSFPCSDSADDNIKNHMPWSYCLKYTHTPRFSRSNLILLILLPPEAAHPYHIQH